MTPDIYTFPRQCGLSPYHTSTTRQQVLRNDERHRFSTAEDSATASTHCTYETTGLS